MQTSVTERVLRTLNLALHVALPLIILGLLLALPTLERSARYPWFLGVAALTVATAAAAASVLAFRRVVREGRISDALVAAGFGALAATSTFAAITTLTGAANTLAPHDTVGRFALATAFTAAAWARLTDLRGGGRPGAGIPDARGRALRAGAAFIGIEAVLGLSALLAALGVGSPAVGSGARPPVDPLVLVDVVSAALFCVATAALVLQAPQPRIRVPAVAATLLLAVGTVVVVLARPGHVDVAVGQLTLAAGCLAGSVSLLAGTRDRIRLIEGMKVLASRLDDGVFLFDERLVVLWINDAGRELAGVERGRRAATLAEVFGVDAHSADVADDTARGTRDARRPRYVEIDAAPGGTVPLALAISETVLDERGVLTLVVARDVSTQRQDLADIERVSADLTAAATEREELLRALEAERTERSRSAFRDADTGVASEEAIMDRLRIDVAQARRYPHPLAIGLVELRSADGAPGPLREVATRLQLRLRVGDAVGRIGERRFLLVLPHTEEHGAHVLADAVRARMTDRPIQTDSGEVPLDVAIGIAVLNPGSEVSPDDLLTRAASRLEHDNAQADDGTPAAPEAGPDDAPPEPEEPPVSIRDEADGARNGA